MKAEVSRWLSLVFVLLTACGSGRSGGPQLPASTQLGTKYQMVGSGPLVVVLAESMQVTINRDPAKVTSHLLSAGYAVLGIDLPCHGADAEPGVSPLSCWAQRIAGGDRGIFMRFCEDLKDVLDSLRPTKVAVVGISRGGYVAATCASHDARLHNIVLLEPVTDLNRLVEFQAHPVDEAAFGLDQYVPSLHQRNILVRIGKADDRVGTDLAEAFAQKVGATLQLLDIAGHTTTEDGNGVKWLQNQGF